MKLVEQKPFKSIRAGDVSGLKIPRFVVLTGRNGAGKSNLLEALHNGSILIDELGLLTGSQTRLFSLGQLLAAAEGPVAASQYREGWSTAYNQVQGIKTNLVQNAGEDPQNQDQFVLNQLAGMNVMSSATAKRMQENSGKRLIDLTLEEFEDFAPLLGGVRDPFAASAAEIFLSYAGRRWTNHVKQFRDSRTGGSTSITDEAFSLKFGEAPWELLNSTLLIVGLPYSFVPPPEDVEKATYEVLLVNELGDSIRPGDLSSGERVLLAVAMSLFTGSNLTDSIELPRLLLLDEADASLHPSMVRSLLTVIEEIFVKQYGVTVIMATHSPTTVALAPESSLHVMSRSTPKLRKTTTDEALQILTVGISALSVKVENRRQVFVESVYDQAIFQELFALIKPRLTTDCSLEFIATGQREISGGASAVKLFVKDLRKAGVGTVFGIVDRDKRSGTPSSVYFIEDRYAIENLVLDPLLLGTFLLREGIVSSSSLGLAPGKRSFELSVDDAASIVNSVCTLLGLEPAATRTVAYAGGFEVEVPVSVLDMQGHQLEKLVLESFRPSKVSSSN